MRRLAPTRATQTDLSCSSTLLAHVRRPIPRGDSRRQQVRTRRLRAWPSPRHARLGSPIVSLSRRQASLHVVARVLAPLGTARAASRLVTPRCGLRDLSRRLGSATRSSGSCLAGLSPVGSSKRETGRWPRGLRLDSSGRTMRSSVPPQGPNGRSPRPCRGGSESKTARSASTGFLLARGRRARGRRIQSPSCAPIEMPAPWMSAIP